MEKTRSHSKKKKPKLKVLNLEFPVVVYDKLLTIAHLSNTTLDQTISVLISAYIVDEKVYHNAQPNYGVGLGDK